MAREKQIFTAPWYPWYVRDVLTSERVDLLSLAEEGAYRRALDKAWMIGSVPADPKACAAVIGNRCTAKIAERVLRLFVAMPDRPDRMVNLKLETVRAEQKRKYKTRSKTGKQNIAKRWKKDAEKNEEVFDEKNQNNFENKSEIPVNDDKQTASGDSNAIPTAKHSESESESLKRDDFKRLIDTCVRANGSVDARVVEIAVIETMMRRKGSANEGRPIKSARYFDEEIRTLAANALASNTIDVMLLRRRQQAGLLPEEACP